jgi:ankyrin repeat protein
MNDQGAPLETSIPHVFQVFNPDSKEEAHFVCGGPDKCYVQKWAHDIHEAIVQLRIHERDPSTQVQFGWQHYLLMGSLHSAVLTGDLHLAESIMQENPAEIDQIDNAGNTCVHIISHQGNLTMLKLLLASDESSRRGRRKARYNMINAAGSLPIHLAAEQGHLEVLEYLLKEESSLVRCLDGAQASPLTLCVLSGKRQALACVSLLVSHGSNINERVDQGKTLLHLVAESGSIEMAEALLNERADANIVDDSAMSALALAVRASSLGMVSLLLERGAQVNFRPIGKLSPLELADSVDMVSTLVNNGARWPPISVVPAKNAAAMAAPVASAPGIFDRFSKLLGADDATLEAPKALSDADRSFFYGQLDDSMKRKVKLSLDLFTAREEAMVSAMVASAPFVPDDASHCCLICHDDFTVVNRRHHCRRCGLLVCDACTVQKVTDSSNLLHRTCTGCWNVLFYQHQHRKAALNLLDAAPVATAAARGSVASPVLPPPARTSIAAPVLPPSTWGSVNQNKATTQTQQDATGTSFVV